MSDKALTVKQTRESAQKRETAEPDAREPVAQVQQADLETLHRAVADPRVARPSDILALQRTVGNHATGHLIQTKLTVGAAGDRYEHEADRVAEQILVAPRAKIHGSTTASQPLTASGEVDVSGGPHQAQRQEEAEKLARTPDTRIQRLIVNANSDPIEGELSQSRGWIMATAIKLALNKGGRDQKLVDLVDLPDDIHVGWRENIYLIGHGSPGKVGTTEPRDVAAKIEPILPQGFAKWLRGYWGEIRSFSCSTGAVPEGGGQTGVHGLATELATARGTHGIPVSGAAGVAFSHPELGRTGSETRAVRGGEEGYRENVFEAEQQKREELHVDDRWATWTYGRLISKGDNSFKGAADEGSRISQEFYQQFVEQDERVNFMPAAESVVTEKT